MPLLSVFTVFSACLVSVLAPGKGCILNIYPRISSYLWQIRKRASIAFSKKKIMACASNISTFVGICTYREESFFCKHKPYLFCGFALLIYNDFAELWRISLTKFRGQCRNTQP